MKYELYELNGDFSLGFSMGRDFLVPQDKGTEVSSLSQDKGTKGKKSLHCPGTKGQRDKLKILTPNWPGQDFDILTLYGPGRDFHSLSRSVPEYPGTPTGQTGKKGKKLQFVSTEDCAKHSLKNEWTLKTIFDPFVVMAPHCFGEDAFSVFTSLAYHTWPERILRSKSSK